MISGAMLVRGALKLFEKALAKLDRAIEKLDQEEATVAAEQRRRTENFEAYIAESNESLADINDSRAQAKRARTRIAELVA